MTRDGRFPGFCDPDVTGTGLPTTAKPWNNDHTGRMIPSMTNQWKCLCPDCPSTDFKPDNATSFDDEVPTGVCGGRCGKEHPLDSFKRVSRP